MGIIMGRQKLCMLRTQSIINHTCNLPLCMHMLTYVMQVYMDILCTYTYVRTCITSCSRCCMRMFTCMFWIEQ